MSEEATGANGTAGEAAAAAGNAATGSGVAGSGSSTANLADWSTHIPKELATDKTWERVKGKDLGEVLKRYVELDKYNAGAIKLPGEKDAPEERDKKLGEIFGKLGRPAEASGYSVGEMTWPEGYQISEAHDQGFKMAAHKMGLTQGQYQGVMKFFAEYVGESMQAVSGAATASWKEGEAQLRKDWGSSYDGNVKLAQVGLMSLANSALGDEAEAKGLMDRIKQTPLANDPAFMKTIAKLGFMMEEDKLISVDRSVTNSASIQEKIDTIKADPDYWNDRSPRYEQLMKQVDALYKEKQALEQLVGR